MKMPKDCIKCPLCLFADGYWKCLADGSHADFGGTCRPQNCPLVELPDHGDLIDRDALMAHKGSAYDIDGHELYAVGTGTILRMPVVIPAERNVKVCPLYSDDEVTEYCVEGPCTDEMEGRCPIAERSADERE